MADSRLTVNVQCSLLFERQRDGVRKTILTSIQNGVVDTCGNVCTGSGMESVSISSVMSVARSHGVVGAIQFLFKAERKPSIQQFLMRCDRNLKALFVDIMDFRDPSGLARCALSGGKRVPVPSPKMLSGGFPCTDTSNLNRNSSSFLMPSRQAADPPGRASG